MRYFWLCGLMLMVGLAKGEAIEQTKLLDQLHEEAKQAFVAADYSTALTKWQSALNQARLLNQPEYISKFLVNLGVIHYQQGHYQSALHHYQQALTIDRERQDKSAQSADLVNIGLVNYSLGQYQVALDYYQQALTLQAASGDQLGKGNTLGNISLVYNSLGKYLEAVNYGKQALALHQEHQDQQAIGNDLSNLGMVYDNLGEYTQALNYYQQAFAIRKELGDRYGMANSLANIGTAYQKVSNYPDALNYYHQALEIQKEVDDQSGIGKTLTNLGTIADSLGQYPQALEYYQQALLIHTKLGDQASLASNLANIGVVYDNLGQYQSALTYYQKSLDIQKVIGDQQGVGQTLSNLGIVYQNLGDFSSALTHSQQALKIQRDLGDKAGEANTLTNLGVVYNSQGQYPQALVHYLDALEIQQMLGNKQRVGNNFSNLGVLYYNLGQPESALGYLLQALTIRREIGDKVGESTDLGHLGVVYDSLDMSAKALTTYQQALASKQALKDKRGEEIVLSHLGALHANLGNYQAALEHFQPALQIARELGDRQGEGADLANIGLIYQKLGQLQQAYTALQASVKQLEELGTDKRWYAHRGLATIQVQLNQSEAALTQYEQAIDIIEKLRTNLQDKTDKLAFISDKLYVYDEFITLLQALHQEHPHQGYDRKALEIFERKQGRVFLEEIGKSGATRFGRLPETVTQQERSLTEQYSTTQTDLVAARNKPLLEQDQARIKTFTQQLATLTTEQTHLQNYIQQHYPDYYALKYPQPASVTALQNEVLQPDERLLIYGVMAHQTVLWVVGPQQLAIFTLPLGEDKLRELVAYIRDVIINRLPEFVEESEPLYQLLLPEPVRPLLAQAHTLYVVPTGPLYMLPFETLVTHTTEENIPHYLVEKYSISYLSSASLLKILREVQSRRQIQPNKKLLAFADPAYSSCQENTTSRTVTRAQTAAQVRTKAYRDVLGAVCFPSLPETAAEANAIAALFNSTDNDLYLGKAANLKTLFQLNQANQLSDYRYVLFATHGLLPYEVDGLAQAALVLSHPETEGYLTTAKAFRLQLNADFINLSACNTGGGEKIKGEGVMGLTRAFMYAGTSAIGVTLWSVESSSAENMSVGIFENLTQGHKAAEALRQIKLKMISGKANQPYYRHPFYWAPFVVYGDSSALAAKRK
jgi:tetratricopeptide (TPR) repeat protein/CHAT domain-containing protein